MTTKLVEEQTKTERLLRAIKRSKNGFTRKEMVQYLLNLEGEEYTPQDNGTYNALIYGTSNRTGLVEKFLKAKTYIRVNGAKAPTVYKLREDVKIQAPFTTSVW